MADRQLDISTRLALERTRLAAERTLMAWIRTSTSLIAFGFTIFKFFQYLATEEARRGPLLSSWAVGMIMIVIGLAALVLAWFQHRQEMKTLRAEGAHMPLPGRGHRRPDRLPRTVRPGCRGLAPVARDGWPGPQRSSVFLPGGGQVQGGVNPTASLSTSAAEIGILGGHPLG